MKAHISPLVYKIITKGQESDIDKLLSSKSEEIEGLFMEEEMGFLDGKPLSLYEKLERFLWRLSGSTDDLIWSIKYYTQRIYRKSHTSDRDLFELYPRLTDLILPKLEAFKNSHRAGHPMCFCDWTPTKDDPKYGGMGMTKAQYEKDKKKGIFKGGGMKAWDKTLDEMIFAFNFIKYHEYGGKKQAAFFERYKIKDPTAETKANMHLNYVYKSKEDGHMMWSGERLKNEKKYELVKTEPIYYNTESEKALYERAEKGLQLFAKHFLSLWD